MIMKTLFFEGGGGVISMRCIHHTYNLYPAIFFIPTTPSKALCDPLFFLSLPPPPPPIMN